MKSLFILLFSLSLAIASYTQPINDLCANAVELTADQPLLIDNSLANQNEGIWGECWGFGQGEGEQSSLWYSIETPDEPFTLSVEAFADGSNTLTDTQFGLFEECGGEMIACDGNSGNGLFSAFNFLCGELNPSSSYILMVDGWNGDAGTCFLQMNIGECGDSLVYGCTDPLAMNYNPLANVNDGSCVYDNTCDGVETQITIEAENDLIGFWILTNSQGFVQSGQFNNTYLSYDLCLIDECYELTIYTDTVLNSSFWLSISAGDFSFEAEVPISAENSVSFEVGTGCGEPIYGCTDPNALNYNPLATISDSSCVYAECPTELITEMITCNSYFVFLDVPSNTNDGQWFLNGDFYQEGFVEAYFVFDNPGTYEVCYYNPVDSCYSELCTQITVTEDCPDPCLESITYITNSDSCGFTFFADPFSDSNQILWTFGDGNSMIAGHLIDYEFELPGTYDVCAQNLNSDCQSLACIVVDAEICGIAGCMDPNAINYNPNATIDDGSCVYANCDAEIFFEPYDCINFTIGIELDFPNQVSGMWTINGIPYLPGGPFIDWVAPSPGTYEVCYTYALPDSSFCTICSSISIDEDCFDPCIEFVDYSQTDSCAYMFFANPFIEGSELLWDFGDGTTLVAGPYTVHQFDSAGTYTVCAFYLEALCDFVYCVDIEVGTCGEIYGCMDPLATNYNPLATADDGSCTYDFSCEIGFSLVPDSTGLSTIWIIPDFGEGIPDSVFWSFGDGGSSTELYPQHSYEGEGPFQLCLSASLALPNGGTCSGTFCAMVSGDMVNGSGFGSSGFTINVIDPAVLSTNEENDISGLNLYPNPTADRLWIEIPSIDDAFLDLNIFDMRGVQVYETRIQNNRAGILSELDINNLASGTYVLSLKGDTKFATRPFIVVK